MVRTVVGGLDEPEPASPEVPLFAKPTRDPEDPAGHLVWTGALALPTHVNLRARSLIELAAQARNHLDHEFPDEAVTLRIFVVPDARTDTIRAGDIAEVSVRSVGPDAGWPE